MKHISALIAATIVTGLLAMGIFAVGVNAMSNQNRAPVFNSPQAATNGSVDSTSVNPSSSQQAQDLQAQIQQLQNLVSQYQGREKQYQDQLNTVTQELNQASSQLQDFQNLLIALQQRGVISIQPDGTILIPHRFTGGDDNNFLGPQGNNQGNNSSSGIFTQ